jgi:transposase-like protein
MIPITVHCPYCESDALVHNGRAPHGKQKYLYRTCHRQSRENPIPHTSSEERREEILRAYEERSSLRGLERTDCGSRDPR